MSGFSIKAAAAGTLSQNESVNDNGQAGQVEAATGEVERSKVTQDQLKSSWLAYSKMHAENRVMLSQIMDQHHPELSEDGEAFVVTVFNDFQERRLQEFAEDIKQYLASNLKNKHVKMIVKVDDTNEDKQFYTATDKLKLMVETNPDLNLLRKTFDLDLE